MSTSIMPDNIKGTLLSKIYSRALTEASFSKDPSTKVGAIIFDSSGVIISTGYNGFARGVSDSISERYVRPEKYWWTCHAEFNAFMNSARVGSKVGGCFLFSTLPPCLTCANAAVQAGIKHVFTLLPEDFGFIERWAEHMARVPILFKEGGVGYTFLAVQTGGLVVVDSVVAENT